MRHIRISLAIITSILICLGVIMIYSSSGVYAQQELGNHYYFLQRHLVFLTAGLVMTAFVMSIDYRILQQYAKPLMICVVIMLVLVLIPGLGRESFGARRWFSLGPMNFQPSELAKIAMIIYMADFLARKKNAVQYFWQGFVPIMIILGIVSVLIIKQPDLGNTLSIATVSLVMLFIAGTRLKYLVGLMLMVLPVLVLLIVKVPYRMRRITAFLNPWDDPQGAGFQLTQSQIALGSGGLFGKGLGMSTQKLFYLPAAHTDFILSIIGEEMGFIGTVAVIFLFGALIWQGARIAKRTTDPFGYYLAIGIVMMLGLQAVVNIGVSIGAFPTKGLPLPFISYGGSALIFNMMAIGLLLNISRVQDL